VGLQSEQLVGDVGLQMYITMSAITADWLMVWCRVPATDPITGGWKGSASQACINVPND